MTWDRKSESSNAPKLGVSKMSRLPSVLLPCWSKLEAVSTTSFEDRRGFEFLKSLRLFSGWWFFAYPSEKSWNESQLGWLFHSQYDGKVIIQMFQSPPTSFGCFWWFGDGRISSRLRPPCGMTVNLGALTRWPLRLLGKIWGFRLQIY